MSLSTVRERARTRSATGLRYTLGRVVFGDRYGKLVFLACCCLFGLLWRTDVFITDTYAIANGLYSLSNGQFMLTEAAYGPGLETPGAEPVDGGLIARNYGAIVLSLPLWLLLEGLSAVVSLRLALVGLWSLALLAIVVELGDIVDNESVVVGGALGVLVLFLANAALARSLDPSATHLYALQLFHLLVAAFAPVLLYRLLAQMGTRRLGLTGSLLLVLGTPLSLWAMVPKRHALTATVVLAVAYALYRSRVDADGVLFTTGTPFRALAYAVVGLYAWVHAPEALLLLVVLAAVDVPTAPHNGPRTLAVVGSAFLLSLVPFVLTNVALTGSPLRPPRLLAVQSAGAAESQATAGTGGGGFGGLQPPAALIPVLALVAKLTSPLRLLAGELAAGGLVVFERPMQLYHTLVRSGDAAAALDSRGSESVNLSVFESAPVLAAVAGGLPALWGRVRQLSRPKRVLEPETVVDLFAVVVVVAVTLQYATRLPIHAQLTVRYLFPVYPLGAYLLFRVPVVRRTLADHWQTFLWTTAVTTFVGGQLLVVAVYVTAVGLGEAFQLHALLALATAAPLALWSLAGRADGAVGRLGAVLLAVPTSLTMLFALMVAVEYYPVGDTQLLPMVRAVAELLELL